jgi:hypothetical protein
MWLIEYRSAVYGGPFRTADEAQQCAYDAGLAHGEFTIVPLRTTEDLQRHHRNDCAA